MPISDDNRNDARDDSRRGALTVVGTGFRLGGAQVTPEARSHIVRAETLFYVVGDLATAEWLKALNQGATSLADLYGPDRPREDTYRRMQERIEAEVRAGRRVCLALYGHPGVGVRVSHRSVAALRADGYEATMLPAISAEDCLFADLGVDPLADGCLTLEASRFVDLDIRPDPRIPMVLWQVGAVGMTTGPSTDPDQGREGLARLAAALRKHYSDDHQVVLYEASLRPEKGPRIERVALRDLHRAAVSTATTMWVPAT